MKESELIKLEAERAYDKAKDNKHTPVLYAILFFASRILDSQALIMKKLEKYEDVE